jgi:hypothetical protein
MDDGSEARPFANPRLAAMLTLSGEFELPAPCFGRYSSRNIFPDSCFCRNSLDGPLAKPNYSFPAMSREERSSDTRVQGWFAHRYGWAALILLVFCLSATAFGQQQNASTFVLHGLGRATLPLDGDWQFHEGDDLAWASPGYDDSAWHPIQVGRSWEGQGHRNYTGFAWYRRRLVLPPGSAAGWTLALYIPNVESACEVFWNGVKVGSYGKLPPNPVWYGFGGATGNVVVLGPAQSGVLAIRVWKAPIVFLNELEEGGLVAVPQVGSAEAITGLEIAAKYRRLEDRRFSLAVARIAGIVGVVALLLWLRNRSELMLLWLAMAMIYPTARYFLLEAPEALPFRVGYGLIGPMVAINDMALWFLLIALLGLNDRKRLVRWTWIIALTALGLDLVDTFCQFFDWTIWPPHRFLMIDVVTSAPTIYMAVGAGAGLCGLRQTAGSGAVDSGDRCSAEHTVGGAG